jgi:hypothetical protein
VSGQEHSVVVIGLPASGKTTYLAALWHLITADEVDTVLQFDSLGEGELSYLNAIASRWREARAQERTLNAGTKIVSMNLKNKDGRCIRVLFPDLPGEEFDAIWERRECSRSLSGNLNATSVMLFVHADGIRLPAWTADAAALNFAIGEPAGQDEVVPWVPSLAPTQVKLIDLLQVFGSGAFGVKLERLTIVLSAWDKVGLGNVLPEAYLAQYMPMLMQYLRSGQAATSWRIAGISAQGGDYDGSGGTAEEIERLRALDKASLRISVVGGCGAQQDLTEPLAWLIK